MKGCGGGGLHRKGGQLTRQVAGLSLSTSSTEVAWLYGLPTPTPMTGRTGGACLARLLERAVKPSKARTLTPSHTAGQQHSHPSPT